MDSAGQGDRAKSYIDGPNDTGVGRQKNLSLRLFDLRRSLLVLGGLRKIGF